MKHKLPVFAILVVSSQLALAEAANDPVFNESALSTNVTGSESTADTDWGEPVAHPDLLALTDDVGEDLQDKLDANMQFDLVPRDPSDPEFAGTH